MPTILIDADILVYSVCYSCEVPIYVVKSGVYKTRKAAEKAASAKGAQVFKRMNIESEKILRSKLDAKLKQIYDDLGTTNSKLFITDSKVEGNFRSSIATLLPYKGNRTGRVKPVHYKRLRQILIDEFGAIKVTGQEADDQIAIEQMKAFKENGNYEHTIIASIDKDLRTIPGYHYKLSTRFQDFVDEETALKNFYKQLLTGDNVDNIPGLVKLLKIHNREDEANNLSNNKYIKKYEDATVDCTPEQCYNYILGMYEGLGYGQKEIDEIGNLLHLRRYEGQMWSEDRLK